ncbi:FbpB family small basic protein [Sporolactobacillus sp. KGMB 08714]
MKRRPSYIQLVRTNRSEILGDKETLERIDLIIEQRRMKENQKRADRLRK